MKAKLLVTASTFPRWEGDTEPRFVLDLCKNMTDTFDITVLAPAAPGAKDEEMLEGIHVLRYHYFPIHQWETLCYPGAIVPRIKEKKIRVLLVPFLLISLFFKLIKILPEYDIVHAHWLIPQGIIQSLFKKPYIVTGHGGDVMSLNKGMLKKWKRHCLRNAKKVTVVSETLKIKIQKLFPEVQPKIISMGVDTTKFGRKYYVSNYFGQNGKKVVLFVGRLVEIKGVSYLIDAMKEIDGVLVIVGDGPIRSELQKKAEGLGDKVIFLGAKSHDELKSVYASSDLFCAPSVTTAKGEKEGLGLVILEAMASGLPVIASDSGGISQLIQNGINGILCEERNIEQLQKNIERVLWDDDLRSYILRNSKETVEKYSYQNIGKEYCKLFE